MSLGKLGQGSSSDAIVSMLRENNDQDLYLRHAGVMALAGIGDRDALIAASQDGSVAVRMAVLLAYRKMEDQGVSRFLSDAEPLLAVEAARAINDVPILSAMPALANALLGFDPVSFRSDLASETDLVIPMVRRMVNANFRLGATKNLTALVAFSGKLEISESLRSEALERIGEWSDPSPRDKVLGLYRPITAERATDVMPHVVPSIRKLIKGTSTPVAVAAANAAGKLELSELEAELLELVTDIAGETELRVAALNALSRLGSSGFDEAMDVARLDFAVELRKAATRLQANVDPAIAAPQLNAVLVDGSIGEQQVALATLATMNGSVSDEIILRWFGKYVDGALPAALALDVVDAAELRSDARIVEGLEKWKAGLPENDSLGEMKIVLEGGSEEAGRRVFLENPVASCTRCHRIGDVGSDIGPSMDGIGSRLTREQLVESIVFPNRTIAEGFETVVVTTNDEEVHAGILKTESDDELILNTVDQGAVRISKGDIQSRDTGLSGMPEGFIDILSKQDVRDLVEYLFAKK
jgi:quinoprotein glucose dehydrogenase